MALTHDEAFLQAILDRPDDDGLRLIFADWLEEHGNPRGEFIRVQSALAELPAHDSRRPELEAREKALLAEHRDEWLGPFRDLAGAESRRGHDWEFRRGFVERIALDASVFVEQAKKILAWSPVRDVWLHAADELIQQFVELKYLERLACLDLRGNHLGSAGMEALAACPYLVNLRRLDLGGNVIGTAGARALAASPYLTGLLWLDLANNELGAPGVEALAASANLAQLESLNVGWNNLGSIGVEILALSQHHCCQHV